jgi:hypothetical protein
VALPFALYCWRFAGLGFSRQQNEWAQFGAYLNGVVAPLLSILNLFPVAQISLNIQRATKLREEKIQQAKVLFDLNLQWNSKFYEDRTKAHRLLKQYPTLTLEQFSDQHPDKSAPLWIVIGFFQNIEFAISKGNIIEERDAIDLFGQIFTWWDTVAVKRDYPEAWDSHKRIESLRDRVKQLAQPQDLKTWMAKADRDLNSYMQSAMSSGTTEDGTKSGEVFYLACRAGTPSANGEQVLVPVVLARPPQSA